MTQLFFHYLERRAKFSGTRIIKEVILKIFSDHKIDIKRIDYIFCSDAHLLSLNNRFLNHNYFTDVISFTLHQKDQSVEGEIYISIERVRENSKIYKTSFLDEMLRVIFHGALHLCGFEDKGGVQKQLMTLKENKYLKIYKKVSRRTVS